MATREATLFTDSPTPSKKSWTSSGPNSASTVVTLGQSVGGVDGADDYFSLFDTNLGLLLQAVPKGQGAQ